MKIYVVRHGESENNLKGLWTGWCDVPLTQKGTEESKRAGEIIRGICFDKVYSSDLCRAVQTAEAALPGYEIITTPLLREINIGKLENKPVTLAPTLGKEYSSRGYAAYGGESREEFVERVRTFMKQLESTDYQNVAVFSHGGFVRTMLDVVAGNYIPRSSVQCGNCMIAIFELANQVWKLHSWINRF